MKIIPWLMYYPVQQIAKKISPARALLMAGFLGNIEYYTHQKYNPGFTFFMKQITANTPLEGRVEELKRKCFQQRRRAFIARAIYPIHKIIIPIDNIDYLKKYKNQGICFPWFHFGMHTFSTCSIQNALTVPLYLISVLGGKQADNLQFARLQMLKKTMMSKLDYTPIFDVNQFKTICIPNVLRGHGCYMPIFDAATKSSKRYSFLGDNIVLSIKKTAEFTLKHRIPLIPFFTIDDETALAKTVLEPPFETVSSDTIESVERWIVSILERYVLAYPELVEWDIWWRNSLRFRRRFES